MMCEQAACRRAHNSLWSFLSFRLTYNRSFLLAISFSDTPVSMPQRWFSFESMTDSRGCKTIEVAMTSNITQDELKLPTLKVKEAKTGVLM